MQKHEPDTISEAGLRPEEFLVVHIGDEFTNKSVSNDTVRTKNSEMWFFQVSDVSTLRYEPYNLRDDSGNEIGSIDPQSGINYQRLYDEHGDDILRIEDYNWRVYHFSVGVRQDDLRVYPRIPDNQNGGGFDWLSGSQPSPQSGEPFGYIKGEETDYKDPAISLEALSWETSSRSPIQYGFYNANTDKAIKPLLSVKGSAYELRPVHKKEQMLQLMADLSRPPGKRKNSVRQVQFSRSALRSFSFNIPSAWRDAGNNINVSAANMPSDVDKVLEASESGKRQLEDLVEF